MFIKLHGAVCNNRIAFNVDHIEAIQEIKEGSKYYDFHTKNGAKSIISISGNSIPVKESITQIEHLFRGPQPQVVRMKGKEDV